jgi:hypothetical protein
MWLLGGGLTSGRTAEGLAEDGGTGWEGRTEDDGQDEKRAVDAVRKEGLKDGQRDRGRTGEGQDERETDQEKER